MPASIDHDIRPSACPACGNSCRKIISELTAIVEIPAGNPDKFPQRIFSFAVQWFDESMTVAYNKTVFHLLKNGYFINNRWRDSMFFLLWGFWVLLCGRLTLEIGITGAVISALVYAFICAFLDYSPKRELSILCRLPRLTAYILFLVCQIFLSSMATVRLIWSWKKRPEPQLRLFHARLRTDEAKVMLANSITLTPGTITVHHQGDLYVVHCLDRAFAEGLEDSAMERRLARLEGGHS